MEGRIGRVNPREEGTGGNARPNVRRGQGQAQAENVGDGVPQVGIEAMYQFFRNMVQAGVAAGVLGGNAAGAGVPEFSLVNHFAKMSGY